MIGTLELHWPQNSTQTLARKIKTSGRLIRIDENPEGELGINVTRETINRGTLLRPIYQSHLLHQGGSQISRYLSTRLRWASSGLTKVPRIGLREAQIKLAKIHKDKQKERNSIHSKSFTASHTAHISLRQAKAPRYSRTLRRRGTK